MKKVVIFLLLAVHLPLCAQVDNWAVAQKGDKAGIIDLSSGKLITPIIYDEVQPEEDFVLVKKDGLVTLLNLSNGKEMFPLRYEYIQPMGSKYLAVEHNNMMGFIDYTGKEVLPMVYKWLDFQGNNTYYLRTDTSCIVVNEDLEIINTNCQTVERHKQKYITQTVQEKKKDINGFTQYRVGVKDIQTGEMVVPIKYRYINIFQDRYFIVAASVIKGMVKDYGIVNIKGEEIAPMIYRNVRSFYNKDVALLSVPQDDDINFIVELLPGDPANSDEDDTDSTDSFDEELAVSRFPETKDPRRYILVDVLTGDSIVPFDYDYAGETRSSEQNMLIVGRNGKRGLFNFAERKEWAPCIYDDVWNSSYLFDYFKVKSGDKIGLVGPRGVILDCKYEYISLHDEFAIFGMNDKYGLVDYEGNEIFPPIYDGMALEFLEYVEKVLFLTKDEKTIAMNLFTKEELPTVTYNGKSYLVSDNPIVIHNEDGLHGVMDGQTGQLIIPCEYNEIWLDNGYATTYSNDGKMVFDLETGNSVLSFEAEYVDILSNNYAIIELDGKYGIYNYVENKEIIPCKYEEIIPYNYNIIICQLDGKYGTIEIETEEILIPFKYDSLTPYWNFFP